MRNKFVIFAIFLAVCIVLYFFWPFGKRSFDQNKAFAVEISDNGLSFYATANTETVSDFLKEKNITLGEHDYIFPAMDAKIFPGSRITILRAVPVTIEVDGQKIELDTLGTSVRDAISEADVTLSHADKISPALGSLLKPNLDIVVTRINFEEIIVEEDIPFQTIEKEDNTVLWRKKETKQKGEKGIREKTYKITYTNGKETNRVLLGSKITQPPVSQIEVVGTKIIVGKTQTGSATWYSFGDDMTCASLDFPMGKYLRVTNRANGKSVIVQVNDSGPYGKGRVIDLNKKAFQKIGDIGAGVINVKVEEILN
ncbi:MAG: ubiquitin-like domain-containing protein [Patescibacteria group bacterium]|nr:ubiquitin-like domain-containing protein [Patescibacteria group bacterium]